MVTSEELKAFHKRFYNAGNCTIVVSGKIEPTVLSLLQRHFGGSDWAGQPAEKVVYQPQPISELKTRVPVEASVQSAIRIGKTLFNKSHPDYHKLNFLNTLFGGYFGSRLMSNIREEKGYTYGIYSSLHSMLNGGYFGIGTEVGVDVCDAAVKEIYHEIGRLQQEAIPKQEVELVRNYLLGRLQSSLDGPFKISALFKGLLIYDLNIDYIYALIDTINTVTAADLQDLAIKYLNVDEMHEVVVG
jgi:predicted Zn-dependent peptidase